MKGLDTHTIEKTFYST